MANVDKPGEPSNARTTIPLYLVDGVATVWDAQTTLHCVHNISGLRAGTLPGVGQQNAFLGLPITLMREEAAWLVCQVPSAETVAARAAARLAGVAAQAGAARGAAAERAARARAEFASKGDSAARKREERARRKAEARTKKQGDGADEGRVGGQGEGAGGGGNGQATAGGTQGDGPGAVADVSGPAASERRGAPRLAAGPASTALPAEASSGPERLGAADPIPALSAATTNVFTAIPALPIAAPPAADAITSVPHALFPFPASARDRALLAAFSALQTRGYRLGLGPRFGGEYLVYPGDYLRYHAHFTSQVIVDDEPIRPAELVAWGRLGTGTKKASLLCCYDGRPEARRTGDDDDGVEFYSLEWANFG